MGRRLMRDPTAYQSEDNNATSQSRNIPLTVIRLKRCPCTAVSHPDKRDVYLMALFVYCHQTH